MPKISVIIPSYNHAGFIAEAINSVLMQDYEDFELLIADDKSSDNSVEVIQTFTDSRIKTFFLTENIGATRILEFLIRNSRGEYIALLNSDDRWCQGKLSKQIAVMENHPEFAACFTWADFINENSNPLEDNGTLDMKTFIKENRSRYEWLNWFFYHGNCLCHPSILIRKTVYETIGYYNGAYRQLPDFEYWIRLCASYPIHIVEEILVNHRRTTGENENTSAISLNNSKRNLSEVVNIFNWLFTKVDDDTIIRAFQNHFIHKEASGRAEIICEKYFLMARNPVFGSVLKNQACQFFMDHYLDDEVARCFKEKYQYTQKEFFADNILSYNGFEYLFENKQSEQLTLYSTVFYAYHSFTPEKSFLVYPVLDGSCIKIHFTLTEDAKKIRIDPVEGYGILVNRVDASVNATPIQIHPLNCQKYQSFDCFLTKDPQYIINGTFRKGDSFEIVLFIESILSYTPYQIENAQIATKSDFETTLYSIRQQTPTSVFDKIKRHF